MPYQSNYTGVNMHLNSRKTPISKQIGTQDDYLTLGFRFDIFSATVLLLKKKKQDRKCCIHSVTINLQCLGSKCNYIALESM